MKIAIACALVVVAAAACKGSGESNASPASSTSGAPSGSTAAQAAASSAIGTPGAQDAPVEVAGAYESKVGAVRTPPDVAPFKDETTTALGAGTFDVKLPATDGEALGEAHGALGDLVFSGSVAEGRLTGTLYPKDNSAPGMRGVVDATIDGAGDARVVSGVIRASGYDGTVVREAAFTLKKK